MKEEFNYEWRIVAPEEKDWIKQIALVVNNKVLGYLVQYNNDENETVWHSYIDGRIGYLGAWFTEEAAKIHLANKLNVVGYDATTEAFALEIRTLKLLDYIMSACHWCPFKDEVGIDFEKECVGFREKGCRECIYRHIDKL